MSKVDIVMGLVVAGSFTIDLLWYFKVIKKEK